MSHNPVSTTGPSENSALNSVEAAKAKQNSLRERLAARRQLLASVTSHSTRTSTSNPLLPTSTQSSGVRTFSKPFISGNHPTTVSIIKSALKRKSTDTPTNTTRLLNNASLNSSEHHIEEGSHKLQTAVPTTDVKQLDHSTTLLDKPSEAEKSPVLRQSFEQSTNSKQQVTDELCPGTIHVNPERKSNISETKQCRDESIPSDKNKHTLNKCNLQKEPSQRVELVLENLLGAETTREKESKRIREEVMELLNRQSTKERFLTERFRTQGGSQVQQFCSHGTRTECSKVKARTGDKKRCTKLHFRKIIHPHTDESLGDCSFLNTCFHVDTCKYVHYTIDYTDSVNQSHGVNQNLLNKDRQDNYSATNDMDSNSDFAKSQASATTADSTSSSVKENGTPLILYPPQWINCDIRLINMSILGKFAVIMADPPWDIHMELPYGTMSDDEMRRLDIPCLQDDGYIFLWVTGRAMELGRECLHLWGYERVDEIIWVKTNQLQRLIRTGRTGHWLNHGKEHCLVGVKGNPKGVNRGLDCDIIVSEVRETSHKPDEIYGIIERLSPGTRKLELFGRPHNLQPNWITLGNQLDGTYLVDPAVVERFKKHYPTGLDSKAK
ncbi:N6-adenosine-methyltransferase subunit METTL3 [Schistosoma japonicum]|uniref:mRNA m(6)A methyltransferase n=1 Tax=Schistosoma japonicum TaxID=6182 RepID=A0A4Z2CVX1_SCHJA|nr:N6-adenosine-methyltransferase subunit METTL3 [Schistosoma japonicum]